MVASGAWTQIEAAPAQPRSGRAALTVDGHDASSGSRSPRAAAARLRRHSRPVLGALDAGGVALQRSAGAAILGAAAFIVPVMVINLVLTRAAFEHFSSLDDSVVSVSQLITGVDAATGVETVVTYLALVASSLSVALAGAYVTLLLVRRVLGQEDRPIRCLRTVLSRLPAIVMAWAIAHSWVLLADIVAARASVRDLAPFAVFLVPAVVWMVGVTVFVMPVVVVERLGPWRGVRRALRLARARGGQVFAFSCACILVGGGLRLVVAALPRELEWTGLISFGRFGWLAEGLAAQFAQLLVVPLIGLSSASLYLQVRMDAEGLDLAVEAGRAFP